MKKGFVRAMMPEIVIGSCILILAAVLMVGACRDIAKSERLARIHLSRQAQLAEFAKLKEETRKINEKNRLSAEAWFAKPTTNSP